MSFLDNVLEAVYTYLTDHEFVTVIVAGQVGENASSTRYNIDVITAQQLDQGAQETFHPLLEKAEDGKGRINN